MPDLPDDWDIEWADSERGFHYGRFLDLYGGECSIQQSSLASDCAIWFGIDAPEVKVFKMGEGWQDLKLPKGAVVFGRMHLNQRQVARLIPILQQFVRTGEVADVHPLVRLAQEAEDGEVRSDIPLPGKHRQGGMCYRRVKE